MNRSCTTLLFAALLAGAGSCASAPATPKAPDLATPGDFHTIPARIAQGSLLRARVLPGSRLELWRSDEAPVWVRVGSDGGFAIAAGRDEAGPLRLEYRPPGKPSRTIEIAVDKRDWQLERIQGVPESTVNPPPQIAERIAREQALVAAARTRDDDRSDFEQAFQWPLQGRVSGVFGSQRIYNGTPKSPHSGLDVAAAQGTPVHAPAGGIVTLAEPDLYLTGGTVLLDHGHGVSSSFLHFSRIDVKVGQRVEQGDVLGLVGMTGRATGPHMHWGLNWFGVRVDPRLLLPEATPPATPSAGAKPSR
jgi:murein DD-endopeptidase MepM/ murein hydrolase activator NlpD